MVNRKKRLKKGIKSLNKQIEIHEEKKEEAEREGRFELMEYYRKEILSKKEAKKRKEELLKR